MFCKYSKEMSNVAKPNKNTEKNSQRNSEISTVGVYVREDDQDWGSSGMNNIVHEDDTNQ